MGRIDFYNYIINEHPEIKENNFAIKLLNNIFDEAEELNENDQYIYLCKMIPLIPERIIRNVCF